MQRRINAILIAITIAIIVLVARSSAHAGSLYWDANGTAANTLTTAAGEWGTSVFWNTSSTGTGGSLTATTTSSDDLFFSSGTNYTGTFTVDINNSSNQFANSITVEEGAITITESSGSGSTINISGGGITINSGAGLTLSGTKLTIITAAQTWTNNSASLFSVSVPITNGANLLTIAGTGNTTISGVIGSGSGGLTKSGSGTLTLSGANTYTGATTINAGTLRLDSAGSTSPRLVGTSGITVNSGGTLLMANSSGTTSNDRIGNAATMTLAGGTFNTGGLSERGGTVLAPTAGIGALTLTATSTIDFGAGTTSMIEFAGVGTHTLGTVLQIINWDGIAGTGGGTEALLFAGTTTAFTSIYNQADVSFNGIAGYDAVQFTGFYEITKVPEPGTWIGGSLALAALAFSQRRRILSKLNSRLAVGR